MSPRKTTPPPAAAAPPPLEAPAPTPEAPAPLDDVTVALPPELGSPDPTAAASRVPGATGCGQPSPPTTVLSIGTGGIPTSVWRCTLPPGHPGEGHLAGDSVVVCAVWGPGYYRGWEQTVDLQARP